MFLHDLPWANETAANIFYLKYPYKTHKSFLFTLSSNYFIENMRDDDLNCQHTLKIDFVRSMNVVHINHRKKTDFLYENFCKHLQSWHFFFRKHTHTHTHFEWIRNRFKKSIFPYPKRSIWTLLCRFLSILRKIFLENVSSSIKSRIH